MENKKVLGLDKMLTEIEDRNMTCDFLDLLHPPRKEYKLLNDGFITDVKNMTTRISKIIGDIITFDYEHNLESDKIILRFIAIDTNKFKIIKIDRLDTHDIKHINNLIKYIENCLIVYFNKHQG